MKSLPSFGLNQYQRTAQVYPAILCAAPLFAMAAIWTPGALGVVSTVGSIGVSAAITMFVMQVGRSLGRKAEAQRCLGTPVSIAALRHDDELLSPTIRLRYHESLRQQGLHVPSRDEQFQDPVAADAAYEAAISWLREQTRDEKHFPLIQVENRTYGFRRNLLGLKPIGLIIWISAIIVDVCLIMLAHPAVAVRNTALLLLMMLAGGCAAWIWIVTQGFVLDASKGYALRLLAACEAPKLRGKSKFK